MESSFAYVGNMNSTSKKPVYYEGTDTIYEGMVLCYNQDTTTDMNGSTVAEGSQCAGKYTRVEKPATANMKFIAGVVAGLSKAGQAGPSYIDVYELNGAIVTMRGTESFTIGDAVYAIPADYEVTNVPLANGILVGYAEETIDRSTTEGLVLVRTVVPVAIGQSKLTVVTNKLTAASPVALTVADAGQIFTNEGAAGAIEFDLPAAATCVGCEYTFSITDGTAGNNIAIDPNGSEIINFGNDADVCGAGELLTLTPADANDAGMNITLVSNGTAWVVKSAYAQGAAKFVIP